MNPENFLAALFIGAGVLLAGCEQREENPAAIQNEAVPPVPVTPPGKVGDPEGGQGLTEPPPQQGLVGEPDVPGVDTTIADIMNRPDLYVGRVVTVVSDVEEIFTPWAFKLDEEQALSGGVDSDLLVVGAIPLASWGFDASWTGSKVKVTGPVRILQAEDFRREYGRGIDDLLFRRYEGKPVIVARSAEKAD